MANRLPVSNQKLYGFLSYPSGTSNPSSTASAYLYASSPSATSRSSKPIGLSEGRPRYVTSTKSGSKSGLIAVTTCLVNSSCTGATTSFSRYFCWLTRSSLAIMYSSEAVCTPLLALSTAIFASFIPSCISVYLPVITPSVSM